MQQRNITRRKCMNYVSGLILICRLLLLVKTDDFLRREALGRELLVLEHPESSAGQEPMPVKVDVERKILFVHVGKAGGQSIKNCLSFRCEWEEEEKEQCLESVPKSHLYNLTKYKVHIYRFKRSKMENATSFLYNIRHPVDRAVSAYWMYHPLSRCNEESRRDGTCAPYTRSCSEESYQAGTCVRGWRKFTRLNRIYFQHCFPSPEDLAQSVALSPTKPECARPAMDSLTGRWAPDKYFNWNLQHLAYNYRHYANRTLIPFPEKEVLAVRSNRLWDDLKELDAWLGGDGDLGDADGTTESWGSEQIVDKRPLTPGGYRLLCCALQEELSIYHKILFSAANLSPFEKERTWSKDLEKCGAKSWQNLQNRCESLVDMKLIKERLRKKWGYALI